MLKMRQELTNLRMLNKALVKENEELRDKIEDQHNEIIWAHGEIDFLNEWQKDNMIELRWYERMLRKVLS